MAEEQLKNFNWYPGHIAKAERQLKEKIKIIDLIIELRDARIPESSRHKDLPEWAKNKPIVTVLNKIDLADETKMKEYRKFGYLFVDSRKPQTIKTIVRKIEEVSRPILEKYLAKGLVSFTVKVMVVGYPNVGKSSLINALAKNKKAKVENRPGVTRQQQWIDLNSDIKNLEVKLLDTPGIIPTRLYSDDQALKLALCNCLGDNAYDHVLVARAGMELLEKLYPQVLTNFYKLNSNSDFLEAFAIAQNLVKDQYPDLERAADRFLSDLRIGKTGHFSFD